MEKVTLADIENHIKEELIENNFRLEKTNLKNFKKFVEFITSKLIHHKFSISSTELLSFFQFSL